MPEITKELIYPLALASPVNSQRQPLGGHSHKPRPDVLGCYWSANHFLLATDAPVEVTASISSIILITCVQGTKVKQQKRGQPELKVL